MKFLVLALALVLVQAESAGALSLRQYLEQVKTQNPSARFEAQNLSSLKLKLNEAEGPYSPELYSEYHLMNNRQEALNPFSAMETRGRRWTVGVRDQTTFGLSADAFLTSTRANLLGVNPNFVPLSDYEQSTMGLKLTQSLWRNGFGASSRADYEAARTNSRMQVLESQFKLKNILLGAENTYWSLVTADEIIKLQTENVERARRLRDHMRQRADLRLFDDVDAMQTEASFQQRELELQNSINDRAALARQFNNLRGTATDMVDQLEPLPTGEMMLKTTNDPSRHMSREDFRALAEQASILESRAQSSESQLKPKLDLVGGIAGHGLDRNTAPSLQEAQKGQHPDWNIGVVFSVALDYRLIGDMKRAYQAQARAAKDLRERARFDEDRVWDDLLKKNHDAQGLFERSLTLEKLMTELVKKERQRLLNGRSTTIQSVTIEKNLADSQMMRVNAQLKLLQIHNLLKQFEELP